MDEQLIHTLNQLNQDFYEKIANDFSQTRQQPWSGWEQLLPVIKKELGEHQALKVLDIGCGNGRFGTYLQENIQPIQVAYVGIDNNQALLDEAKESLSKISAFKSLQFTKVDILRSVPKEKADIICLFGVMHHIPSFDLRQNMLQQLAENLLPGGLFIFTAWQFDQLPNIFDRRVSPDTINISSSLLEKNDFLLTWERGTKAIRYCHLINEEELSQLTAQIPLKILDTYFADGKNQHANRYVILQKPI